MKTDADRTYSKLLRPGDPAAEEVPIHNLSDLISAIHGTIRLLRVLTPILLALTLANFALTIMALNMNSQSALHPLPAGALLLFLLATLSAYWFEAKRKEGSFLFEMLIDFLHHEKGNENKDETQRRLENQARLSIRRFSDVSDLPLFPGRVGISILVALNVIFALISNLS